MTCHPVLNKEEWSRILWVSIDHLANLALVLAANSSWHSAFRLSSREKERRKSSRSRSSSGDSHGREMVGGCCVCADERGWDENPLVYCDGQGCNVAVHQGSMNT